MRRVDYIESFIQDVRYSLRVLARSPGFAVVAVLVLALGIGANTAIFSLLDQAILRSLPVKDPGRLVVLNDGVYRQGWSTSDAEEMVYSYPHYKEVRDLIPLFDGVIARAHVPLSVASGGTSERAGVMWSAETSSRYWVSAQRSVGVLDPEDDRVPEPAPWLS